MNTQQLAERFTISDRLTITDHHENWPVIHVNNQYATAEIHIHAAHITHYQPHGAQPVLWLSDEALYRPGKAIRGGIPLIWPWFGPHPTDAAKPQHGFVRTSWWQLTKTEENYAGETEISFTLEDSEETRPLWPHPFRLALLVTIGQKLQVAFTMQHKGDAPVDITAALHTYFKVGDINQVRVHGLEGTRFIDKVKHGREEVEDKPLQIRHEIDRVYYNTTADCLIKDASLKRTIRVSKKGSLSTVVWNPWTDKAQNMSDFPDDGYEEMLCIETVNASEYDTITLEPGGLHTLSAVISVEPL